MLRRRSDASSRTRDRSQSDASRAPSPAIATFVPSSLGANQDILDARSSPTPIPGTSNVAANIPSPSQSPLRSIFVPPTPSKETRIRSLGGGSDSETEASSPGAGIYAPIAFEYTAAGRAAAARSTTSRTATSPTRTHAGPSRPALATSTPAGGPSRIPLSSSRPSAPHRHTSSLSEPSREPAEAAYQRSASPYSLALGQHLFESGLLNSQLSDVNILCFGRIYRLHRLVLAQVDFFSQLLDGDWREAASGAGRRNGDDCIRLQFDANVTRASWEYCLATIYGGGPELVPLPWAQVDGEPLLLGRTFALLQRRFLGPQAADPASEQDEQNDWARFLPPNSPLHTGLLGVYASRNSIQPATPTFLLSLLSCASYLGMTPLINSTVALVQDTLTPFTIRTYLDFAQGKNIRMSAEERDAPCRTLEGISLIAPLDASSSATITPRRGGSGFFDSGETSPDSEGQDCVKESSTGDAASIAPSMADSTASLSYGPPADRIGEACACWLAKWAADVLPLEEALESSEASAGTETSLQEAAVVESSPWLAPPKLALWGRGGLSSKWIRGLVSSDAFFLGRDVRGVGDAADVVGTGGEWERYGFAKRVAELRQKQAAASGAKGDDPEMARLFEEGIYYAHLSFAQLAMIAKDRSSATKRRLVSQARLQRAHWESDEFRNAIPQSQPGLQSALGFPYSSQIPGPATEAPLELDFTRPIGISEEEERESKPHYLVPIDRTCRLNDAALTGSEPAATSSNGGPLFNRIYIDGDHFFGLGREVIHGALDEASHQVLASPSHVDPDLLRGRRCNVYEPCRFSVEFFDVSQLKDKQRLYSLTSFFGGSLFNMYLQVVRNQKRSSLQLGLYLHRQAIYEAPPAPSRPSVTPGADGTQPAVGTHALFGEGSRLRSATMQASNSASGTSPGSPGFPNLHGLDIRSGGNGSTGNQAGAMTSPYIDSRKAVQAYFAVHSPTLRGTAATLFASGPDAFANSQSWGYRSSSLLSAEYIGSSATVLGGGGNKASAAAGTGPAKGSAGRYSSLRCTVTIGLS